MSLEDISTFRNMLRINKDRLDDELEIQSELLERIGRKVTFFNSRQLEAKDALAKVEARLTLEVKEDDPKLSLDLIAAKVKRDKERETAWKAYQVARAEYEDWSVLYEAWKGRGFDIGRLGDLYRDQYFSIESAGMTRERPVSVRVAVPTTAHKEAADRSESAVRRRVATRETEETEARPRRRSLT